MFAWTENISHRSKSRVYGAAETMPTSANRRTVGLMPSSSLQGEKQVFSCRDIKFQKFLMQIEVRRSTCCIRVSSSAKKSRGAILVFRGRVLGCVYGNKNFTQQVFGYDAMQYTFTDMMSSDTVVETYLLNEEIALAAGSTFHSRPMNANQSEDPYDLLQRAINGLLRTRSPGCVIISNCEGQAVCMLYLFGGKITAIYSFMAGWMEPTFETAELCLSSVPEPQVYASALASNSIEDALRMTLSFTGLTVDRPQLKSIFESNFNPYESQDRIANSQTYRQAPAPAMQSVG